MIRLNVRVAFRDGSRTQCGEMVCSDTLKDRCRMDTDDYTFDVQFGKGLLSTLEGWEGIEDRFSVVPCRREFQN